MTFLRAVASRLLATGELSAGWYAVLTGLVLLYLAWVLGSVSWEVDRAAPLVAVALAVTGAWQLERGVRTEYRRRRTPTDMPS